MSGKGRKSGPTKAAKGAAAERERRRRQAELLRTNLLKRKEQSRNRRKDARVAGRPRHPKSLPHIAWISAEKRKSAICVPAVYREECAHGQEQRQELQQSVLGMASGQSLPDPSLPGLEYRRRAGGVFVRYRYKDPRTGRWTASASASWPRARSRTSMASGAWNRARSPSSPCARKPSPRLRLSAKAATRAPARPGRPSDPRALAAYEADLARRGAAKGREVLSLLRRELLPSASLSAPSLARTCSSVSPTSRRAAGPARPRNCGSGRTCF